MLYKCDCKDKEISYKKTRNTKKIKKSQLIQGVVGAAQTVHDVMNGKQKPGIIQKIRDGIPIDEVMYQADHYSLETTNTYVRIANPEVFKNVRDLSSKF